MQLYTAINKVGKLPAKAEERLEATFQRLRGKRILITIEKQRKIRSVQQNRWLWGVAYRLLSEHTGYKVNEIHEICKWKFLEKRNLIVKDESIEIPGTTTNLTTTEFMGYKTEIQEWAAFLGCDIPDPNEETFEIEDKK